MGIFEEFQKKVGDAVGTSPDVNEEINDHVEEQAPELSIDNPDSDSLEVTGEESTIPESQENVNEPTEPQWEPDFKYSVGQQEFEIEEKFRDLIKSPEAETYLKDLHIKSKQLETFIPQAQHIHQQNQQLNQIFQDIQSQVQAGDIKKLVDFLKIPESKIMDYARERASYQLMKPEDQEKYDRQREYETNLAATQQQLETLKVENLKNELNANLNRPEVSQFAQNFDQRSGIPNAFINEVINRGIAYSNRGQDVSPTQVVAEVMQTFRGFVPVENGSPGPQSQPQIHNPTTQQWTNNQSYQNQGHFQNQMPPVQGVQQFPSQGFVAQQQVFQQQPQNFGAQAQPQNPPSTVQRGGHIPNYGKASGTPAKKKIKTFEQFQQAINEHLSGQNHKG